MKHIFANKTGLLFAMGCALALTTTSCIREDIDACPAHKLTVKVININGGEITETAADDRIEEVTVFIFDESLTLLSTHHMTTADVKGRRLIDLPYPEGTKLHAIAWGNAYAGNQNVSSGNLAEELKVMLKQQQERADTPNELYYGNEDILTKAVETEIVDTVTIQVKVGTLKAYTDGLPEVYKSMLKADGDPIQLYVNRTLSEWDYDGVLKGDSVYYTPEPYYNRDELHPDEMSTGYNYYATGQAMNLVLELPYEPTRTETLDAVDGRPIFVEPGKETDVVFTWDGEGNYLGIRVYVREWGYIEDPIEW